MSSPSRDPDLLREMIKGQFLFETDQRSPWKTVYFEFPSRSDIDNADDNELDAADDELDDEVVRGIPAELLRMNPDMNIVEIFPLRKFPEKKFATRRYKNIRKISLEGFGLGCPEDPDEVLELLSSLPRGFIQNPDYGLGLRKEYRFIVEAIETVDVINQIQISRIRDTSISGNTYVLSFRHFEAIRKALNNTHTRALNNARVDKSILAYNGLLHEVDGNAYPERRRPYTVDTVFKAIEGRIPRNLSEKDQMTAVALVQESKDSLIKNHCKKLIGLQHEIELVTLKQLIEKMDSLLSRKLPETEWQKFFIEHPFVLSLAFALPIVIIRDQVSVGGRSFSGAGEKIADFLGKNGFTENLALIEIKTPHANLLGKQYRGGAYSASADLVGCITQVLDQRHKLQAELSFRKINARLFDIEAYAVRCLIVIGMTPNEIEQKKSLELFRGNLHDVIIITFDELLEKLRHIHKFLSSGSLPDSKSAKASP